MTLRTPSPWRRQRSRLSRAAVVAAAAAMAVPLLTAGPAQAQLIGQPASPAQALPTGHALPPVTAAAVAPRAKKTGAKGQTLTVTPTRGLAPYGQTVKVKGKGFSELVGIYVGLCVQPRTGAKPTPCGGGVDQDGSSQASAWISSNPPPYGNSLAIPYKRGGKFTVRIKVSPMIGSVDCRKVRCAIVARADHLRASDRSWDVVVPVTFR